MSTTTPSTHKNGSSPRRVRMLQGQAEGDLADLKDIMEAQAQASV